MTAATTPRLTLMSPTNADDFTPDDFVDTFTKLDNRPGILPVANFAALPTGLTSANHGTIYLQLDNGSLWQWNRPGAPAGSWRKINTVGLVKYAGQTTQVSSSSTADATGATILSTTFTAPGGRELIAFFSHWSIVNSGSLGMARCTMWLDSDLVEHSQVSSGAPNKGASHRMLQGIGPLPAGTTHTLRISICAVATGGGGTTTASPTGQLYIWEI